MTDNKIEMDQMKDWKMYSPMSEVWVYQSKREWSEEEAMHIDSLAKDFIANWNSHGVKVVGAFQLLYNRFVVFLAEKDNSPSGCSKDSMVHFIENVGKRYSIDFFDRMDVAYVNEESKVSICHLHELSDKIKDGIISSDTKVFNNLVNNKADFDNSWKVSIKDSWHSNFI